MSHDGNTALLENLYEQQLDELSKSHPQMTQEVAEKIAAKRAQEAFEDLAQ
tara:strand:+ start:425 stop:577 length:153 start_codon:yes stop_codon:yes gene_type:complete